MTREEARKNAKVMLAYADGKNLQFSPQGKESWQPCKNPMFDFCEYAYRVHPESQYRPFKSQEECWNEIQKHQPIGWVFDVSFYNTQICRVRKDGVNLFNEYISYSDAVGNKILRFTDGTPFGIKVEEE